MPDQEFLHRFNDQDLASALRCSNCLSGFRSSFYSDCVYCGRDVVPQEGKPDSRNEKAPQAVPFLRGADIPPAPVSQPAHAEVVAPFRPTPQVPVTRADRGRPPLSVQAAADNLLLHREAETDNLGTVGQLAATSRTSSRRLLHQHEPLYGGGGKSPSARRSGDGLRGRPPAGTRQGPQHGIKGVRTRKGVKGFLVEIRPPKWKRTIWLGTYNTLFEAAGAYDAGIFYTKKPSSKYNFQSSEGAFPPLPSHLRLDNVDNEVEIKMFVKRQAQEAARRVKSVGNQQSAHEDRTADVMPVAATSAPAAISSSSSSSSSPTSGGSVSDDQTPKHSMAGSCDAVMDLVDDANRQIPMDLQFVMQNMYLQYADPCLLTGDIFSEESMYADYADYQQGWISSFELKQAPAFLQQNSEENDPRITSTMDRHPSALANPSAATTDDDDDGQNHYETFQWFLERTALTDAV